MSTQFTNRQWRLPNNENKDKQSNYSMDFDGSQYIDASTLSVTGDWSVSLWVNSNSTSYQTAVQLANTTTTGTNDSTIFLYYYPGGASAGWGFYDGSSPLMGSALNTGQWYNLVVTKSGTTYTLFLNGTQENQNTKANINIEDLLIGKRSINLFYMDGQIDAVSIFNYALTDGTNGTVNQIAALYGSSSTGIGNPMSLSPKPVAYYPLGDQDAFNGANYLVPNIAAQEDDGDIAVSYSPYALDFDAASSDYIDTNSTFNTLTSFSISAWFKADDTAGTVRSIVSTRVNGITTSKGFDIYISANVLTARVYNNGATEVVQSFTDTTSWHNVVMTYNGTTLELFLDNSSIGTATGNFVNSGGKNLTIGKWGPVSGASYYFDGSISNVSIWNTDLTSTQVTELYNEGVPSNLNNHSAYSNLVSWWQLGSNSSFNTNWTVLDEKGSNNGTSVNMGEDAIVDGVGSYANGLSSGMGGDEVIGDAPYSTANALSVNMDVEDRVTDTPS